MTQKENNKATARQWYQQYNPYNNNEIYLLNNHHHQQQAGLSLQKHISIQTYAYMYTLIDTNTRKTSVNTFWHVSYMNNYDCKYTTTKVFVTVYVIAFCLYLCLCGCKQKHMEFFSFFNIHSFFFCATCVWNFDIIIHNSAIYHCISRTCKMTIVDFFN